MARRTDARLAPVGPRLPLAQGDQHGAFDRRVRHVTIGRVGERSDLDRIAVGIRMRDEFGGDVPASTSFVLDYGLLAPNLR